MDPILRDYLRDVPPALRPAACDLADLVAEAAPDAVLRLKYGCPMWHVDGADFCYLLRGKDQVSLGFQQGSDLDDPRGILVALGKARDARHVVVREGGGVPAQTRGFVERAAALARLRIR
jgi:hypothetical protein